MKNDGELLWDYFRHGDEEAFSALVSRHINFVYATALRQLAGDVHRARDVSQCVFVDLAGKAEQLAARSTLVGWLHISVHHAAAQLRRNEQRRQAREKEAHIMETNLRAHGDQADWEQLRPVLDTAISELTDIDREAVLLRFFEQRPVAEIGAILHVSEEAARKRVVRALDRLHGLLAKRGITSTAGALGILLANQTAVAAPAGFAATVTNAALSVGSTGGGIAVMAALVKFMSTTKILTAIVAAAALFAIALFCIRQNETLAPATAANEPKREHSVELAKTPTVSPAMVEKPEDSSVAKLLPPPIEELSVERRREAADRAAHTAILEELFGDLLHDMQLTSDERGKLLSLLVEARRSAIDAVRLGRAASLTDREASAKLVRDAAMSADKDILSLLGEQRFEEFVAYRSTLEGRTTVRLLQAQLDGSGHELSPIQRAEVVRLYIQSQRGTALYYPETAAILQVTGTTLNDRILSALGPALTKEQSDALKHMQGEQLARHKAQKEYAESVRAKRKK